MTQLKRRDGTLIAEGEQSLRELVEQNRKNLTEADLPRANLSGADLTGADLTEANLFRANLSGANLTGANLTEANLYEANLTGANLTEANLSGADLTRADLYEANLTGADLSRADLFRADLFRANLSGANLADTGGLGTLPAEIMELRAKVQGLEAQPDPVVVAPAPRPDTRAGEAAALLAAFREALEECSRILGMPGSPELTDVPRVLRERLGQRSIEPRP